MEEGGATPAMLLGSALELLLGPEAAPCFDNVESLDHTLKHAGKALSADMETLQLRPSLVVPWAGVFDDILAMDGCGSGTW